MYNYFFWVTYEEKSLNKFNLYSFNIDSFSISLTVLSSSSSSLNSSLSELFFNSLSVISNFLEQYLTLFASDLNDLVLFLPFL